MQAPRCKLMISKGLKRFFELPIIQAPRRNVKVHKEMWTNPCFVEGLLGATNECAALHKSLASDTSVFKRERQVHSAHRSLLAIMLLFGEGREPEAYSGLLTDCSHGRSVDLYWFLTVRAQFST